MSATLHGTVRDKLGSRFSRVLRRQGRIPASIQGEGKDSIHLSIDEDEFLTARRHHEHLFDIELGRSATETALVRELQWDTFGDAIFHVEFRRVIRGQKTEVEVELSFVGHPKGGSVNHLMPQIAVLALPSQIPDTIEVRVDGLEEGASVLAGDLELPEGVDLATDPEAQVATVSAIKEVVETPEEGEGEAAAEGEQAAPTDSSEAPPAGDEEGA